MMTEAQASGELICLVLILSCQIVTEEGSNHVDDVVNALLLTPPSRPTVRNRDRPIATGMSLKPKEAYMAGLKTKKEKDLKSTKFCSDCMINIYQSTTINIQTR